MAKTAYISTSRCQLLHKKSLASADISTAGDGSGGTLTLYFGINTTTPAYNIAFTKNIIRLLSLTFSSTDLTLTNNIGNRQDYPKVKFLPSLFHGGQFQSSSLYYEIPIPTEETISEMKIPGGHMNLNLTIGRPKSMTSINVICQNVVGKTYASSLNISILRA